RWTMFSRVDVIYNLACPASPKHYQSDPVSTLLTCVLGARHVADTARETSARIVHASTSEVYGSATQHPQTESYWGNVNPLGPRSCYDEGKRAAETLLTDSGVDVRIARIFNTYGPRMSPDDGRAVPAFVRQALAGESLTVYGDGLQTRSLCYVDDLIDGLVMLGASASVEGPINLGNPEEITVL